MRRSVVKALITISWELACAFGDVARIVWCGVISEAASPSEEQRRQMESLVRGMSLPLTVSLGHAQLTTSQFAQLSVGDVVVLNQRTREPLKALLSGKPTFLGWPGQIGNKQAFQIETELTKRHERGGNRD